MGCELRVARLLHGCDDAVSFVTNSHSTGCKIEYRNATRGTANYYSGFVVKQTVDEVWIIEAKGREDLDDPLKRHRLEQWCDDTSAHDPGCRFRSLFVREEDWDQYPPGNFEELSRAFARKFEPAMYSPNPAVRWPRR